MSLFWNWLKRLTDDGSNTVVAPEHKATGDSAMNEGDFHSGPGGYSPGAGYPDTFYGSGEYLLGDADDEGGYR